MVDRAQHQPVRRLNGQTSNGGLNRRELALLPFGIHDYELRIIKPQLFANRIRTGAQHHACSGHARMSRGLQ